MKKFLGAYLFGAALTASSHAHAEKLSEGEWALGVERLYGITSTTETTNSPGGKVKSSTLNYSLFANPASSQRTVYSTPRLAADYLINSRWSAGMGAGLVGGSTSTKTDGNKLDGPGIFGLVVAPRAGFLVFQTKSVAFWPKAGFTFTTWTAKSDTSKASQFRGALSAEATFLVLPGDTLFLSFTPMIDWGIFGANSTGSGESIRATALEYGLQGGLGVHF